jgi:two-component system, NarL family, response regulator DevR
MVRIGLKTIFADYPQVRVIGEADNAATALREITQLKPQVALVDLRLPDSDGCRLCRKLKALPAPPRVLILTSFSESENILMAMGSGADGYLLKDSRDDVLISAITMVASGGTVWPNLAARTLRKGLRRSDTNRTDKLGLLTPQELRVLATLAEGKTNKEISHLFGVAEKTVRNQVSSIMRKLEVEHRSQAAIFYIKNRGRL